MPVASSPGCGPWGGGIISENIALKQYIHYRNSIWVISGSMPKEPKDEGLFCSIMKK